MLNKFSFVFDPEAKVPKYRQFADALSCHLSGVEYIPGTKLSNDRKLAQAYGISVVTVSRALNLLVKRGIIARKVGSGTYICPPEVSGGKRIALVCHEKISNDGGFVTGLWNELHRQAPGYGVDLLMIQAAPEDYRKAFVNYGLHGMIILSAEKKFLPELAKLYDSGLNIAQVGMWHKEIPQISFGTDHEAAAAKVVDILHKSGHRKIAFLVRSSNGELQCGSAERLRGYQLGMFRNNLPVHPDWIFYGQYSKSHLLKEYLHKLSREDNMPTAFIFEQLLFTINLRHAISELGLSVPEDVSMVVFDNNLCEAESYFPLSSYTHETVDMVTGIFDHLMHRKHHDGSPLPAKFINRGSCKNIKSNSRKISENNQRKEKKK